MSNIGKKNIKIPTNLNIDFNKSYLIIKNKKQEVKIQIPKTLNVKQNNDLIIITPLIGIKPDINIKKTKILWGTFRSILCNYIIGLSQGFKIILKFEGVGYRAIILENKILQLKVGFSHLINLDIPKTINVTCFKPNILILKSYDKLQLSQYAALIRSYKLPEPYKGKGILYKGEKIIKKEGKKK